LLISTNALFAQSDLKSNSNKTINNPIINQLPNDTLKNNLITKPIISGDTIKSVTVDSLDTENEQALEHPIIYNARDSIRYETKGNKVYLFGDAFVEYDGMNLKSEFIEIDNDKSTITAFGKKIV